MTRYQSPGTRPAADHPVVDGGEPWPPPLGRERVEGMWLIPNGGDGRHLLLWLRPDGTFVRGVVHHPDGDPGRVRVEDVTRDAPWGLRRDAGPTVLALGEAARRPDGSTVSTAQHLAVVHVAADALALDAGVLGDLRGHRPTYTRASPAAARRVGELVGPAPGDASTPDGPARRGGGAAVPPR